MLYSFYFFLDGYFAYNQIIITSEDQEKTTFICPYGTFAFQRMPFSLCISGLVEDIMEIFMDDFLVSKGSFDHHLKILELVLQRCVQLFACI